jgi:hypothetical protein
LAAWPLEALALTLVLATEAPGPSVLLERLLAWAIGAVLPATLFWRLPPSPMSLLLLQVPAAGLTSSQRALLALPLPTWLKAIRALGVLPLLWLLVQADGLAPQALGWSPLHTSPRLVGLMLAAGLLALLLWQWDQFVQALWLLLRQPRQGDGSTDSERLTLGLPILLLAPLRRVPVPPEHPAEEPHGQDLDEEVPAGDVETRREPAQHDEQPQDAGAGEGDPEPPT